MTRRRAIRARLIIEELEDRCVPSAYYVTTTGSDNSSGLAGAPWLTLRHAAAVVQPGDTVHVAAGTYAGFDVTTSGTASQLIRFLADPGVAITAPEPMRGKDGINLEGASYIDVEGFNASGMAEAGIRAVNDTGIVLKNNTTDSNGAWGIFTGFSNNLDIENNTCTRSQTQHGIYVSNSCVNPVIRNNVVWGNADSGIQLNGDLSQGGTGLITGALVVGNVIHDNGTSGGSAINCDGVQNAVIESNLLYTNHASGIALFQIDGATGSKNNVIADNTIVMASDARWALTLQNASTGNVVFNNILLDNNAANGSIDISTDSLSGFFSDYNAVMNRFTTSDGATVQSLAQWQAATGQDLHSFIAAASQLFRNPAGNDYHLAAGSPAIDAGTANLAGDTAPTTDLDGNPRPSGAGYDIGAYEYQSAVTLPPSSLNYTAGFASATGLTLNGAAKISGSRLRLTDGGANEAASVFSSAAVSVAPFSTQFTFQLTNANADGFAFVIQGKGPTALGGAGGYLGYAGIGSSLAIKFDLYSNAGEGSDSTGLYTSGANPFTPSIDLSGTGINLHSGDVFRVTLSYDGSTLTETITDTNTLAAWTHAYTNLTLASVVGGSTAYVGFTAGTGGLSATQDILNWSYLSF